MKHTMTTYSKLRDGSWGIRGTGAAPQAMTQTTVMKRSGDSKTETIGRVLWQDGQAWLATLVATERRAMNGGRTYGGRRTGCYCGSRLGVLANSDCWQCRHDGE